MYNERPRITVPFKPIDIVFDLSTMTLILVMIIYIITEYSGLPETIPIHFNAKGEADDFGSKMTLWIVPIIAVIMAMGLFILNKYPHIHNYMVNITEDNALKYYSFSTRLVRIVNLLTTALMVYIAYYIVSKAKGIDSLLSEYFLPIVIGFTLVIPIVAFLYMKKLNK